MGKTIMKRLTALALCTALVGGSALAVSSYSKTIQIQYSGIKLVVDGAVVTPTDANGNMVEPFTYNGTTYLPVRAVANALGETVSWDESTQTVMIGGSKVTYLDSLSTVSISGNGKNDIYSAYSVDKFPRAVRYLLNDYVKDGEQYPLTLRVEYNLNNEYTHFKASIASTTGNGQAYLKVYGDGNEVLYSSPTVNRDSHPIDIDVDVSNQSRLYLEATKAAGGLLWDADLILSNAQLISE